MKKQQMHQTHTSGKSLWALPVLLASLSACAGPMREGDVDWGEFERIMAEGLSQIEQMDAEIASLNAKHVAADETIVASKAYIAGGVGSGTGDVPTRWETMQEVEDLLEKLELEWPKILGDEAEAEAVRADYANMHRQIVADWLLSAWKTTEKGALNLRVNYGLGASTDSPLKISGTNFDPNGGGTPYTGVLTKASMKTDSSDIGVEYYFSNGMAVEAGAIFGSVIRDDEGLSNNALTLAYDDQDYMGFFIGGKYCFAPSLFGADGGALNGRTRLFVNTRLGLMDEYAFSGTATKPLQNPLPPPVSATFSGNGYTTLGLGVGILFAWTDHIGVEFGINLIQSVSDIEGNWSINGDDGDPDSLNGTFSTDVSMTKAYIGFTFGF